MYVHIYICMYVYIYTHRFGNHSESLKMKAPSSSRLKPSGREGSRQRFQKEGPTSFGAVATMTWTWIGSHAIALALHWFKMFKGSCTIPWYLVGENMKRTQKKNLLGLLRWDELSSVETRRRTRLFRRDASHLCDGSHDELTLIKENIHCGKPKNERGIMGWSQGSLLGYLLGFLTHFHRK